jgi:hypothetical protein
MWPPSLGSKKQETSMKQGELSCAFSMLHFGFFLGLFFNPEDGGTCCSETLVDFQQTIQHYIPEDRYLYNYHYKNFKSYKLIQSTSSHHISLKSVIKSSIHAKISWMVFLCACFLTNFYILLRPLLSSGMKDFESFCFTKNLKDFMYIMLFVIHVNKGGRCMYNKTTRIILLLLRTSFTPVNYLLSSA